jgi:hypothetical protein
LSDVKEAISDRVQNVCVKTRQGDLLGHYLIFRYLTIIPELTQSVEGIYMKIRVFVLHKVSSNLRGPPCHLLLSCPQVADVRKRLQFMRVDAGVLNKQTWRAGKGVGRLGQCKSEYNEYVSVPKKLHF